MLNFSYKLSLAASEEKVSSFHKISKTVVTAGIPNKD